MSEPSLEYNVGKIGYGDVVQISILAYKDGRTYLALMFSSPGNKRLKPILMLLTDFGFSELYKLLMEAEVQINKLLTSDRISSVSLPQTDNVAFRSNLGSVDYSTVTLNVMVVVMNEGNAFLQLYTHDSKSRASGFSAMLDDNEFTKLKKILRDNFDTIIKPKSQTHKKPVSEVRNQKFVTISADGKISELDVRNSAEAHIALKEIGLLRKELNLQKSGVDEKIRQIRSDYSLRVQQQGAKVRGSGWLGKIFRTVQTAQRDNDRYNVAADIAPLERQKRHLQWQLDVLSGYALEIQKIL